MKAASTHELRHSGLNARRQLAQETRARLSDSIQRRFLNSSFFFRAANIACYIATPEEVDTSLVFDLAWRTGKRIFAPVTGDKGTMRFVEARPETKLVRNRYGLWEPESGEEISARKLRTVITPTVAFDRQKQRIGMGGGFYDRAFRNLNNQRNWRPTKLIGFAFDCQKVEEIPANPWDIPLYRVFTENETVL